MTCIFIEIDRKVSNYLLRTCSKWIKLGASHDEVHYIPWIQIRWESLVASSMSCPLTVSFSLGLIILSLISYIVGLLCK
ncbi:hypothetical protein TNIN_344191 [Trichonephila inaurata madagascariensis]|uniref:Uncharacterized protein n=1 Tax=Trichonephila inaurata madagascariensis TaxID=2747483 RepID=A0A8X6YB50_9ARAC|nr:hypothetical protein TNIN_344191 [Trichonephila inaurata madagascariensis]